MKRGRSEVAWVAVTCFALSVAGCHTMSKEAAPAAREVAAVAPAAPPSGLVGANLVSVSATVKAINHKTRHVTLQRSDGSLIKFVASDAVRNLAQVKVGDQVTVTYYEALAYQVKKPGQAAPGTTISAGAQRAKLGEKPGGGAASVATITTTIAGIDKAAETVTLRMPDGSLQTVKVRHPEQLSQVSVGDLVEISYTQALAISVTEPTQD